MAKDAPDFLDDVLRPDAGGVVQPDDSGALPVMAVGGRAASSAEIEARAAAIEADALRHFIPFIEQDGGFVWTSEQREEMAALGIEPDILELALLQEEQERRVP
jgi:hypothetical protein